MCSIPSRAFGARCAARASSAPSGVGFDEVLEVGRDLRCDVGLMLDGAVAYLVGDPGAGFKHMTDMINMSRLANGVRSAGMMRRSGNEAHYLTSNRTAFRRRLADLPLMRRQLDKMLTVAEQGRAMVFHTASVLQRADAGDEAGLGEH